MNTRPGQCAPQRGASAEPVDAETISQTICRALRLGTAPLDPAVLVGLDEELRGHIGLLFPEVRDAAGRMWRGSTEWHDELCASTASNGRSSKASVTRLWQHTSRFSSSPAIVGGCLTSTSRTPDDGAGPHAARIRLRPVRHPLAGSTR